MSKRAAEHYITRDGEDSLDEVSSFKATSSTLGDRKIIVPKSRRKLAGNSSTSNDGNNEMIRALNNKFVDSLVALQTPHTVADFTPLAKKYIDYYQKIVTGGLNGVGSSVGVGSGAGAGVTAGSFAAGTTGSANTAANTASTDSKPNPFAFLKPANSDKLDSGKFGSSNGSDSSKPSSGFSFNSSNEHSKPSTGFSFNSSKPSSNDLTKPSSGFSFNSNESKPSFGFNTTPKESTSIKDNASKPFSFNPPSNDLNKPAGFNPSSNESKKPSEISFNKSASNLSTGSSNNTAPKPTFSFNQTPQEVTKASNNETFKLPGFSFSKSDTSSTGFDFNQSKETQTPSSIFSFGKTSAQTTSETPSFKFGKSNENASNQSSGFKIPDSNYNASNPTTSFNFSSKPTETATPKFGFDKPNDNNDSNQPNSSSSNNSSLPSFGSTSTQLPSKPFAFGANSNVQKADEPASKDESTVPKAAVNKPQIIELSDESEEEEEIKIQGPTFDLANKPTTKRSPFTFGPKPVKKPSLDSDSDSEPEIEIKGPSFTFDKPIADKIFKFKPNGIESNKSTKENNDQSKGEENKPKEPIFSFNKPTDSPSAHSSKPEAKAQEPASFKFATSVPDKETTSEKPLTGFSFGGSTQNTTSAFSFGSKAAEQTSDKTSSEKPAFSFNSDQSSNSASGFTNKTPSFNFNSSEKPTFQFGSTAKKVDENAVFGKSSKTGFNFESKAPETTNTPQFQFALNANSGNIFGGNRSSFGGSHAFNKAATNEDEDKMPEEETGGDFKPVAKLTNEKIDASTGEEGEEVMYTKRAKLMLFDKDNKENPYINKGVGDLRVLKNKETGKSRILIRADGGLRILMNNAISSSISYGSVGDGSLVRVPTIDPTTKSIETYILKVKTGQDGAELLKTINDAKQ